MTLSNSIKANLNLQHAGYVGLVCLHLGLSACVSLSGPTSPASASIPGATPTSPSGAIPTPPSPSSPSGSSTPGSGSPGATPPSSAGSEGGGESAAGDMGEFPQGEADAQTQDGGEPSDSEAGSSTGDSDAGAQDAGAGGLEPGFGNGADAGNDDRLPDLRDEPSLEDTLESFEESIGPAAGDSAAGDAATDSGTGDAGSPAGAAGTDSSGADDSGSQATDGQGIGHRTSVEQAMILNDELERKTSEFDTMILKEQTAQRRAARQQTPTRAATATVATQSGSGDRMAGVMDAGDYSTGGGMGGSSDRSGDVEIPQNPAKYPPPANIPTGNDDDVVARQLREAAMREPDPELRARLWDEYRKYNGLSN